MCALRASGGGPVRLGAEFQLPTCSPRERRWADGGGGRRDRAGVLSARAEVGRPPPRPRSATCRALRASGGGPYLRDDARVAEACSPRERRWAVRGRADTGLVVVLSARAEVGRPSLAPPASPWCALRASGGGPGCPCLPPSPVRCSPRERRWAVRGERQDRGPGVLSARAEVGRRLTALATHGIGALRASGGGPECVSARHTPTSCSPRERRWAGVQDGPRAP